MLVTIWHELVPGTYSAWSKPLWEHFIIIIRVGGDLEVGALHVVRLGNKLTFLHSKSLECNRVNRPVCSILRRYEGLYGRGNISLDTAHGHIS